MKSVHEDDLERRKMVVSFSPRLLLRIEGLTLLLLSATGFFSTGGSWLFFLLLLLVPDLSMLGYLRNPRLGAAVYNLFHSYPLPALLLAVGQFSEGSVLLHLALVWFSHIGMDRAFGYGLKYGTSFKATHLARI